jgi:hypothetical protein
MVKSTDTCVSARHVANMLADMPVTRPKTVSAEVLTMLSRHVTYGYVGREDVVAELILMVNPLYCIMSDAMLNYEWCLALRSVIGTSRVWPK